MILNVNKELSSREMNRAKRKARQAINKQKSRENLDDNMFNDEPDKKKVKTEIKEEYTIQYGKKHILFYNYFIVLKHW